MSRLRETDKDVQITVVTHSRPFRMSGKDCLDGVEVQLRAPLGDRVIVDMHTGQLVNVRK